MASPLDAATPTEQQFEIYDRLKVKLEPFRASALGIAEGVQSVSNMAITAVEQREFGFLNLAPQYNDLDDEEYYEIKKEPRLDAQDCKNTTEERLWQAAVMHRMCQKTVYLLINTIRTVLKDDPDVSKVNWSQKVIQPALVLFSSDRNRSIPIPIYDHDVISIICKDDCRFTLDVTGDQFGLYEWFFTAQLYHRLLWHDMYHWPSTEAQIVERLEQEEPRLPGLKDTVNRAITNEDMWSARNVTWSTLHKLPKSERKTFLEDMEGKLYQEVQTELGADQRAQALTSTAVDNQT